MAAKTSQSQAKLARLDAARKRYGITLEAIAAEASMTSRRGSMSVPTVSKVLSGHTTSANVLGAAQRLIAEARTAARRRTAGHQSVA